MVDIKSLENEILKHKTLYYQGSPVISDFDYDQLEEKLRQVDPDNYVLKMVGSISSSSEKIKHAKKMLSLDKTYDLNELKAWVQDREVVSTYKVDGVSCSLIYEYGKFILGKTRGDGSLGEDISTKIYWINAIPKRIKSSKKIEIRGELFCRQDDFFLLGEEMIKKRLERPSSPRNIVAGLMGRKDNLELCRYLSFQAFNYISDEDEDEFLLEIDKINYLKELGFEIPLYELHKNFASIEQLIQNTKTFMLEGDYQIDGIVFSYNDLKWHQILGETAHHPKYKIAYKYKGESKHTRVKEIIWSVSRNGILTPVAKVEPIELAGAIISRVTLHNYGTVNHYQLKAGDLIEVIRSGEVIPKFLSVVEGGKGKFDIPKECPECHSVIRIDKIRLYCSNDNCPAKIKEQILNFIQKIGIYDLSEKRLEALILKGLVKEIPDLYKLEIEDFQKLEKVQEKLARKLYHSIQKSKEVDLATFVSALSITGCAYNTCQKIIDAGLNTLELMQNITMEQLSKVESFAEKSSRDFISSINEKRDLISKLLELGFNFNKKEMIETPVFGKKICITGALSEKRSVIEKKIRDAGGIVVTSVGKDTDFLLTNEVASDSSKFKKAQALNIKIISENFFLDMMKQ